MPQFNQFQLIRLCILYGISSIIAFLLNPLFQVGYTGWLCLLLIYIPILLVFYFPVRLLQKWPHCFLQEGGQIVSQPVHIFFLICFYVHITIITAINLILFIDFFGNIYLRETPFPILAAIICLATAIAASSGLKGIVYMSDGIWFLVTLSSLIFLPLMFKNINLSMIAALFTNLKLYPVLQGMYFVSHWFTDLIIFLFLLHRFKEKEKFVRSLSIVIGGILFFALIYWLFCLLLFGPYLGRQLRIPALELVRHMLVGQFVENLDPLIVSIWSSTLLIKLTLLLYIGTAITTAIIKKGKSYRRTVTYCYAFLIFITAILWGHRPIDLYYLVPTSFAFFFVIIKAIPLVYSAVYYIRSKMSGPLSKENM